MTADHKVMASRNGKNGETADHKGQDKQIQKDLINDKQ